MQDTSGCRLASKCSVARPSSAFAECTVQSSWINPSNIFVRVCYESQISLQWYIITMPLFPFTDGEEWWNITEAEMKTVKIKNQLSPLQRVLPGLVWCSTAWSIGPVYIAAQIHMRPKLPQQHKASVITFVRSHLLNSCSILKPLLSWACAEKQISEL